jgi:hypothetical protein
MFSIIKNGISKAQVIESYISFIKKYTDLDYIAKENVSDLVNKNGLAKFIGKYECSLFNQFKNYALRFKNNMSSDEFVDVFNVLKEHFGNPTYFSEYKGYVWSKDDIIISYGLVSLNYNYEVPLIQFGSKIGFIDHKIDYVEYKKIADIFKNPFSKHKLELNNYYEIMYTKEFGYIILIMNRSIDYYLIYQYPSKVTHLVINNLS